MPQEVFERFSNVLETSAKNVLEEIGTTQMAPILEKCFLFELNQQGISFVRVSDLPFYYKGHRIDNIRYDGVFILENSLMLQFAEPYSDAFMLDAKRNSAEIDSINCGLTDAVIINLFAANLENILEYVEVKNSTFN